jgi:predicted unusual protein kinase regulating ubiquinone biosynthesis (AarF/ABC1/UbiB family)
MYLLHYHLAMGVLVKAFVSNKRMLMDDKIPSYPLIKRSDDNLVLRCTTEDGRTANASVPSTMSGKIVASAVFIDFGITDAITDKHREYLASFVISIKKK